MLSVKGPLGDRVLRGQPMLLLKGLSEWHLGCLYASALKAIGNWLSRFEMYATQAKIAKDSWTKELLSLLEDEPYRVVTHHGLAQTDDYDAVCDCIQRSYAPLGSELEWQLKVRTRVQKVGESLMEVCGALRGMTDKAFPGWPAEQLQDRLRNQFIQGVLSSSAQLALTMR